MKRLLAIWGGVVMGMETDQDYTEREVNVVERWWRPSVMDYSLSTI